MSESMSLPDYIAGRLNWLRQEQERIKGAIAELVSLQQMAVPEVKEPPAKKGK